LNYNSPENLIIDNIQGSKLNWQRTKYYWQFANSNGLKNNGKQTTVNDERANDNGSKLLSEKFRVQRTNVQYSSSISVLQMRA